MKSYTDIEQSKRLAKILPIESADMHYNDWNDDFCVGYKHTGEYIADLGAPTTIRGELEIPCWSLAVLLGVLPRFINFATHYTFLLIYPTQNLGWVVEYSNHNDFVDFSFDSKNLIDACVDMIESLHGQKLL